MLYEEDYIIWWLCCEWIYISQKAQAKHPSTQNYGVVVKGDVQSGEKDYFGMLSEVIELKYDSRPWVILF